LHANINQSQNVAGKLSGSSWFQRFVLPGLAFKAVVIGGGYATGRELAEYFLPSGPWGGLLGISLAMVFWSLVCAATFALAHVSRSYDYNSFLDTLLGPVRGVFEIAYILLVFVVLAVFGAVAGEIGNAIFGWPTVYGTLLLAALTTVCATLGNVAVEQVFKYVSLLLYGVYAVFFVLILSQFGDRVVTNFTDAPVGPGWVVGGITYASYNVVGAIVVLPVLRHMTRTRDAVVAGILAGPLAMLPAVLFFIGMIAFYPDIGTATLPSDYLLQRLDKPWFHFAFQVMIFAAVLESSVGTVHAVNERFAASWRSSRRSEMSIWLRAGITFTLLIICIFIAGGIGLVDLIATGYRIIAIVFLAMFVVPVLTIGLVRVIAISKDTRNARSPSQADNNQTDSV